jgi:hypothetical protein
MNRHEKNCTLKFVSGARKLLNQIAAGSFAGADKYNDLVTQCFTHQVRLYEVLMTLQSIPSEERGEIRQ